MLHRNSSNFKTLVGILGDVDGRIVPVAPPPFQIRPAVETAAVFAHSRRGDSAAYPSKGPGFSRFSDIATKARSDGAGDGGGRVGPSLRIRVLAVQVTLRTVR